MTTTTGKFANLVKYYRQRINKRQSDFQLFHRVTLSAIETGKLQPSDELVKDLAIELQLSNAETIEFRLLNIKERKKVALDLEDASDETLRQLLRQI